MSVKSRNSTMKAGATQVVGSTKHNSAAPGLYILAEDPSFFNGVTGKAMAIPKTKSLTTHFTTVKIPKFGISKRNCEGDKPEKTSKDATFQVSLDEQNQMLERICMLEREIVQLKTQLEEKDTSLNNVTKLMQDKISEHAQLVEEEQQSHELTREKLEQSENVVAEKIQLLHDHQKEYEQSTEDLKELHKVRVATIIKETTSEINCRDEKIAKMKQQISEILKGKSWERQEQLNGMKKELKSVSDEVTVLERKLELQKSLEQECDNCKSPMSKEEVKILEVRLKKSNN
ncbi:golgin subfamily A member 6-like protein 22 isoform X1 [Callorhinchus milii]|uniref:golgin subfamily A member 6-like protein 22 isoform X1 n=1 Tax=Callorhinchus milii TaxID=7868 RepID=UPI0004571FA2|nr:golgin subfamily A member 6-like protein 22 isoform X1 [Callorhinchus milii]XP_042189289.1 golgin subfamily A member 6-like protein 22 isoform X1 [Callorhinchus milii]XP_042189291.1 golgin subfamily A member 6-like protein 22 isoform X1 [Callorhinchus milii]|eukprot:gi/632950372/ref/XP_007890679.1/ PREDICTED: ERC protein 2-like isoform X1 [Callorhinchus milii]